MNLTSNTAAFYPNGCSNWIRSCSIAHQIHVVSTNAASTKSCIQQYTIKPYTVQNTARIPKKLSTSK